MKGCHLLALVSASLLASMVASSSVGRAANAEPVPIPGGAHLFSPGPRSLGLMGLHVEPSSISDFQGVVALAYLSGSATDGESHRYDLAVDLRIMNGDYVAADGSAQTGTFAFI
ncbi:MAG: hypothetical protein E6J81_14610 [Deltaproteobacteria bacterium]|nr:MAG: hypothetical protein E6J81_14610 [Deltaproteobacteria bacterium]TMA88859.1 MAG: hypothetical protein E6J77_08240 [Deltaproteobacteria bacterium]